MKRPSSQLPSSSIRALALVPRWSGQEGRAALEAWRASGESLAAFAAAHGLCAERVRWWGKQLGSAGRAGAPTPVLVPIDVVATAARPADVVAEVHVGGHVVRVLRGADEATLAEVLRAVGRVAC
jgi:hypothetical protein